MYGKIVPLAFGFALAASTATPVPVSAETAPHIWAQHCEEWDDWDKPAPPFRIHGNSYYVGTCGITSILITGEEGHILIDSGTVAGAEVVLANIETLGFDPLEVKLLLFSHEHHDHVGGMARLIEATGAPLLASVDSAGVMTSGLLDARDPQKDIHDAMAPVSVSGLIVKDTPLTLGSLSVTPVPTPGHTPGATSWTWKSCDDAGECLGIAYADSLSATSADDYRFSDHPDYVARFRVGLNALAAIERCDIFLNPHPSFGDLRNKILAGDLTGGVDCAEHAHRMTARLEARLAQESETE